MSDFKAVKAGTLKEGEKGIRAGSRMKDPWREDEEEALNELVMKALRKWGAKYSDRRVLASVQKWAVTNLPTRSRFAIKIRLGRVICTIAVKKERKRQKALRKENMVLKEENMRLKALATAREHEMEDGELTDNGEE